MKESLKDLKIELKIHLYLETFRFRIMVKFVRESVIKVYISLNRVGFLLFYKRVINITLPQNVYDSSGSTSDFFVMSFNSVAIYFDRDKSIKRNHDVSLFALLIIHYLLSFLKRKNSCS